MGSGSEGLMKSTIKRESEKPKKRGSGRWMMTKFIRAEGIELQMVGGD